MSDGAGICAVCEREQYEQKAKDIALRQAYDALVVAAKAYLDVMADHAPKADRRAARWKLTDAVIEVCQLRPDQLYQP